MILDSNLLFTGTSSGASGGITSTNTTDAPTTGTQTASNVIDLGVGTSSNPAIPALASGGGARDISVGDDPQLKLLAVVTTAFTGGTSLQLVLAGAPDNGSGSAGSYTTMWTSAAFAEADLDRGAQLATISIPGLVPGMSLPRFLRLQFVTVGTHTAGAICAGVVLDRFDQVRGTDSVLSGYPAGITVSN